ncbi:MAG: DUF2953 domain-containing protein [Eubacteriales bacterium]|nr:DUF2953 domain-containing protein [Eubacteriales bacterium]
MIVLRILGILLCIVLILGVALTVFMLCAPMRLECKRKPPDGPVKLRVGFGPIRKVLVLGKRSRKKPESKEKKQPKKQKKKEKQAQAPRYNIQKLDYREVVSLMLTLMDDMAGAMTWERLHVTLILHTADAARTGNLLGLLSAVVGNLYPYMERAFVLQDTKIVIDADFDAEATVWEIDLSVMTRLSRFLHMTWKRRKALWKLWKSIQTTKEEREAWEREHMAPDHLKS